MILHYPRFSFPRKSGNPTLLDNHHFRCSNATTLGVSWIFSDTLYRLTTADHLPKFFFSGKPRSLPNVSQWIVWLSLITVPCFPTWAYPPVIYLAMENDRFIDGLAISNMTIFHSTPLNYQSISQNLEPPISSKQFPLWFTYFWDHFLHWPMAADTEPWATPCEVLRQTTRQASEAPPAEGRGGAHPGSHGDITKITSILRFR
jgi:hypothetical protein